MTLKKAKYNLLKYLWVVIYKILKLPSYLKEYINHILNRLTVKRQINNLMIYYFVIIIQFLRIYQLKSNYQFLQFNTSLIIFDFLKKLFK